MMIVIILVIWTSTLAYTVKFDLKIFLFSRYYYYYKYYSKNFTEDDVNDNESIRKYLN